MNSVPLLLYIVWGALLLDGLGLAVGHVGGLGGVRAPAIPLCGDSGSS